MRNALLKISYALSHLNLKIILTKCKFHIYFTDKALRILVNGQDYQDTKGMS